MSYICLFPMLPADRNTKDEEKVGGWARERVSRQASMLTSLPGFGKPRQRLAVPPVRFQEFVCGTNDFDERRECRWFDDEVVGPFGPAFGNVPGNERGRKKCHGNHLCWGIGPDPTQHLEPVHFGHFQVTEDQVRTR